MKEFYRFKKYNNTQLPTQGLTELVYEDVMNLKSMMAKAIYIYLISGNYYGEVYTSYKKIKEEFGIKQDRTVNDNLKILEEAGLIKRFRKKREKTGEGWRGGNLKIFLLKEGKNKNHQSVSYRRTLEKEIWDQRIDPVDRARCSVVLFYLLGPREQFNKFGEIKITEIKRKLHMKVDKIKETIKLLDLNLIVVEEKGYGKCMFIGMYAYSREMWEEIRPEKLEGNNGAIIENWWKEAGK